MFINKYILIKNNKRINTCCYALKNITDRDDFKGLNVGLSLNILTKANTDLYYHHNIYNPKLFLLELLIGFYTYGLDRYNDNNIDDYRKHIYDISLIIIVSLISSSEELVNVLPMSLLLYSTKHYKNFKHFLGIYKPIYIGVMWSLAICVLPCILNDDDYSILLNPEVYMPFIVLMTSTSNLKDIKDIEEDTKNNIKTFPVVFGINNTKYISIIGIISSIFIYFYNIWLMN